jgi:preprotein translocase subunit SecD
MRRLLIVAAIVFTVVALGVVVFAVAGRSRLPDGPRIKFRVETADGHPADGNDAIAATRVLARRLDGSGLAGVEIVPTVAGEVIVMLPRALAPNLNSIVELAERKGSLAFRITADQTEQRKWRELKQAQDVAPPPELAWIATKDGGPDLLVHTPERPYFVALQKLKKRGVPEDAADYKAVLESYEKTVRQEVFTGADVVRAEAEHMQARHLVFFAFNDDRKPFFKEFTSKHVGEMIAIIIDGKVEAAPMLKSMLPGEGIIEGGGSTGFTQHEAQDLAAVLGSGSFPGRLVRVTTPEPK